jgi:hypothetical protein
MTARVELLYVEGCPGRRVLEARLRELVPQATLELRCIASDEDARRARFLGSPTVRVDGRDVEPGAEAREDFGLKCRLYPPARVPRDAWILEALARSGARGPG